MPVEQESGGRVACVQIRAMNQPSFRKFENEINEGIVVDIRYNGGGNIDQQLIDILERQPYQYWNSRWGTRSWGRRPRQAIAGPKVMPPVDGRGGHRHRSYSLVHGGSIRTPGSDWKSGIGSWELFCANVEG